VNSWAAGRGRRRRVVADRTAQIEVTLGGLLGADIDRKRGGAGDDAERAADGT